MSYRTRCLALSLAIAGPIGLAGSFGLSAQTSAPATPAPGNSAATTAPLPPPPSAVVQPALHNLVSTLDTVRIEKWKAPPAVRQSTEANIQSVRSDLDSNLPSLLHAADGAPGALSALLPAARNLDALYDVVLRVAETAHVAAPARQSSDLDAALADLDKARRSLSARMLSVAQTNEAEIHTLRQQLAARAVVPPPPEPKPCPKPVPKKHVYKKKKPVATTPAPAPVP